MKQSIIFLFLILCVISCTDKQKNAESERFWLPQKTQIAYKINQKDVFLSAIQNNAFWREINLQSISSDVVTILSELPSQDEIGLAFTPENTYLITALEEKSFVEQLLTQKKLTSKWFYTFVGKQLIISSDEFLDKQKENPLLENKEIKALLSSSDPQSIANILITKQRVQDFLGVFFNGNFTQYFASWLSFDLHLSENDIRLSGTAISASADAKSTFYPSDHAKEAVKMMPSNTLQYISYSNSYSNKHLAQEATSFEKSVRGITFCKSDALAFCFVASDDTRYSLAQLPILQEDLQVDFPLFELTQEAEFSTFFERFETDFLPKFVCLYDDFLIFSQEKQSLIAIVDQVRAQKTLPFNASYAQLEQEMASSVGMTQVVNLQSDPDFVGKYPKIAKNYRWVSFQMTAQDDYYIFNFISKKQQIEKSETSLNERFEFVLGAEMLIGPQILKNHRTKRREIVVQDAHYNLYLIGNTGNLLWKKKLDGKIQSKIYQVDLFKNGYLQMAFSTEKSLWVIDRNGNTVSPFPKKYDEKISPLSVYDYEGNLDYRFVLAQGNKIHLLDKKGQPVSGFLPPAEASDLLHTPVHFRTQSMDFLVYGTERGDFRILHRNGGVRIAVDEKFSFSSDLPLLLEDKFMMKTQTGEVVGVDLKGKVTIHKGTVASNQHWIANRHIAAQIIADTLRIGQQNISLPTSDFQNLKTFRIRGVNYISATDSSIHKVYLWNDNAREIQGFPLQGKAIDIDVDLDKNVWIAIAKDDNTLAVYQIGTLIPQ
ncbi:hypothetical protein ACIRNY_05085 [Capnocytophaga canimorsus]|uniref:hypothetical protein n=1 Tax=Capnocytophaga canimorsus TaxID=28188 RepID=UPI00384D7718